MQMQDPKLDTSNNYNLMKELLFEEIVNNTMDLWLEKIPHTYRRCTCVRRNECFICNTVHASGSFQMFTGNRGRCNLEGWLVCEKYIKWIELYIMYMKIRSNSLYDTTGMCLNDIDFKFWRVSLSDPSMEPYIQDKATTNNFYGEVIKIENGIVYIELNWNPEGLGFDFSTSLRKYVPLSNVILHNREIFGYSLCDCPILKYDLDITQHKNWRKKWIPLLQDAYNTANTWSNIETMLLDKIPSELVDKVYSVWKKMAIV